MNDDFIQHIAQQWQHHFGHADADMLSPLRNQQFSQFMEQGLPDNKNEQWKYTNLTPLKKLRLNFASQQETVHNNVEQYFLQDCYRLVFVDGFYRADWSLVELAQDFVVTNLDVALRDHLSIVQSHLSSLKDTSAFSQLNTACLKNGAFIFVPKHCRVEKPVQLLFLNSSNSEKNINNIRNIIVAQLGAHVEIIEDHVSIDNATYFTNTVTDLHVNECASVDYLKIQNQNKNSFHVGSINIIQKKDSLVNLHHLSLGGQLAREDLHCHLNESGSNISIHGLYLPLLQQHIDVHTYINHNADNTTSEEYYKGIVAEKCRAVFNGKISVAKNIKHAIANLQNKNLLLSPNSEVNTKPELEIYSDDVKCHHGATVGQLDAQMLFYLRSRGIPKEAAYQLLLVAFINAHLNTIPQPSIAKKIKKLVTNYCEEIL